MNQLVAVLLAVGATCLLMSVSGAPSNFDYGDDTYAFADNATTPISNSSASTPSANVTGSTPSSNVTTPAAGNVTTPATGNVTTPATGNMTTPASGNMTTPTGKTTPAKSTVMTTAFVTTPTKSNVTASPETGDDGFSTGSFFGGAGAMIGIIAVVALACLFMKKGKTKGYNAM